MLNHTITNMYDGLLKNIANVWVLMRPEGSHMAARCDNS